MNKYENSIGFRYMSYMSYICLSVHVYYKPAEGEPLKKTVFFFFFFGGTLRFIAEDQQKQLRETKISLSPMCFPHFLQLNTSLFSVCPDMTTLLLFSPWTVATRPYLAVVLPQAVIYAVYSICLNCCMGLGKSWLLWQPCSK